MHRKREELAGLELERQRTTPSTGASRNVLTLGVSWKTRATRSLPTQPPMVDTGARACGLGRHARRHGRRGGRRHTGTRRSGGAGGTGAPVRNVARTAFVRQVRATYIKRPAAQRPAATPS